jgi:hypothetical protein
MTGKLGHISAIVYVDGAGKEHSVPMRVTAQTANGNDRYAPEDNEHGVTGTMYVLPAKARKSTTLNGEVITYKPIEGMNDAQAKAIAEAKAILAKAGVAIGKGGKASAKKAS